MPFAVGGHLGFESLCVGCPNYCAMAARRIGQYIPDWIRISARVPAEARPDMARFRAKYEMIKTSLEAVPAKPQALNWEEYSQKISKPGMVEAFRKAYEAVTVPFPKDTESSNIDKKEIELEQHAVRVIKESKVRIQEYEDELQKIKALKPFEEMTVDEYLEQYPELKKQAEEEIKKNIWM